MMVDFTTMVFEGGAYVPLKYPGGYNKISEYVMTRNRRPSTRLTACLVNCHGWCFIGHLEKTGSQWMPSFHGRNSGTEEFKEESGPSFPTDNAAEEWLLDRLEGYDSELRKRRRIWLDENTSKEVGL